MKLYDKLKGHMTSERVNKKLVFALFLGYSIAVAVICLFPTGASDMEWYSFYSYLNKHEATPYVDVREGYPPFGFLIYEPLYCIFRDNPTAFGYSFKALNGIFLVATLFTLYLILKEQYKKREALDRVMYYAILPSVIIANTYSNDVIALFPAALAIYMMLNKKALPCGVLLGLATLGKGFPALLLIPAFLAFTDSRDRLKLIGSTFLVLVFASLPFLLFNPLTYLSTFTHVGSRGPWETVWAISDGYYSHGGLLHPFFDKFFYHSNLLKIYPTSHYDHAIYSWNFGQLPNLLTILQAAVVAIISVSYLKRKKDTIQLCGFLYIGYMLFFKGYSTQFAVSTPFYLLLAASGTPLLYLLPLEVSHIMQMLAWNSQSLAPEFLRNEHLPILVSAVILRSIVFAALTINAFRSSEFSVKYGASLVGRLDLGLKWLKDKWLIIFVIATIGMALISMVPLINYVNGNAGFKSQKGTIGVSQSEWNSITINDLEKGDQVLVKLTTNTLMEAKLANSAEQVEQGIRNPYNLKDSFNDTMLFFRADSESCDLMLRMKHQEMPFRVIEGLEGDLTVNVTKENGALTFKLQDSGTDGNASVFTMAYPVEIRVTDSFCLNLNYRLIEGNASNVWVYVFDDTDEWLYPFVASENYVLTRETKDVYGHANLIGDDISLVEVSVLVDDGTTTVLELDEFSVNNNERHSINFFASPIEEIKYEAFIERDFTPSVSYASALLATVALSVLTIYYIHLKLRKEERQNT